MVGATLAFALAHVVALALLAFVLAPASHVQHLDRGPLRVQQHSQALKRVEALP